LFVKLILDTMILKDTMIVSDALLIAFISILFIALVAFMYTIRIKKKVEIKTSDLTIAFIPIFLILLFTGGIEEFDFFGIKAKLRNTVEEKITKVEYEEINIERLIQVEKGGADEIQLALKKDPEALVFELGKYYSVNVINKYINTIPSISFLVIKDESSKFIGLIEVSNYRKINDKENLVRLIPDSDQTELFKNIPNLVTLNKALKINNTTRKDALEYFSNNERAMILPIIDEEERFEGILRREVLTSNLLQTIFKEIE